MSIAGCLVLFGGCCHRSSRGVTASARYKQKAYQTNKRSRSVFSNLLSKSVFAKKRPKLEFMNSPAHSKFIPKRRSEFQSEAMDRRSRASAMLVAARSGRINLFGELAEHRRPSYVSRANIALARHTVTNVGADYDVDIDPTGQRMVFASTRHHLEPDLYMKAVDGVAVTQLTSDPASDIQPVFSPDGSRVAFASNRSGNWDIWVMNVNGGPPAQVTRGMADEIHPSWSSDGNELVFCSLPTDGGQWELWINSALEGGTSKFIGYGLFPDWSPDGLTIAYQRARERGSRWFSIWTLTMVDGEPKYPTEIAASSSEAMILPAWSFDGTRIAFASTSVIPNTNEPMTINPTSNYEEALFDIWVTYADGRGKLRLTDGQTVNFAPAFDPDDRIYFTSNRAGSENIWSMSPGEHPAYATEGEVTTINHDRHQGAWQGTGTNTGTAQTVSDGY